MPSLRDLLTLTGLVKPKKWGRPQCPRHGCGWFSYAGSNDHTHHSDGSHSHTMYYRCTAPGCKWAGADDWWYYTHASDEQIEVDRASFLEEGRAFWVPDYRIQPHGPVSPDPYR